MRSSVVSLKPACMALVKEPPSQNIPKQWYHPWASVCFFFAQCQRPQQIMWEQERNLWCACGTPGESLNPLQQKRCCEVATTLLIYGNSRPGVTVEWNYRRTSAARLGWKDNDGELIRVQTYHRLHRNFCRCNCETDCSSWSAHASSTTIGALLPVATARIKRCAIHFTPTVLTVKKMNGWATR